jgi:rhamnogalacturonyl hydrolase YesR
MDKIKLVSLALLATGLFSLNGIPCSAQKKDSWLKHFPRQSSPRQIGNRVARRFLESQHPDFGRKKPPKSITYPEVCTWYGALTFAKATHNREMKVALVKRFEPLFSSKASLVPKPDHVDHTVFGTVPLEICMLTGDKRYLDLGLKFPDAQWGAPFGSHVTPASLAFYKEGLSWQTRMWIDDMFMITAVEVQAYRASGQEKYIDRAAKEMVAYLDSLQRPNGLFYHAPDVPFFWGRGNGWVATGMTEILKSLPADNAYRSRIMAGYQKMMAALLKYQTPQGVWRQLLTDTAAWPETSGSGMFTYAMITGVKKGWLSRDVYGPAARRAWLGLISYLDKNGDMHNVCEGTNKKNNRQYYLDRKRNIGDMHGQAPVLWCATALLDQDVKQGKI